ncbi:MAG: AMP-binding protein [Alphaproteobacteria bacterium]
MHELDLAVLRRSNVLLPNSIQDAIRFHAIVSAEDQALSYRRLNHVSNQIAHAILGRCGEGEAPIALLFEQGASLVAAILGALKAGKIYVALDARDDRSHLTRVVADSQPELIVTAARHLTVAADLAGSEDRVLTMDALQSDCSSSNPGIALSPNRRAYIYYTSGSTGPAKGVVDTHRNVLHNIMRYTNNLHICLEDRLSLVQSCSFSGTVSSLFCALLNGACIFPFDLRAAGAKRMARWLDRERITVFHSVPVIFDHLMLAGPKADSLRVIRLEGDQTFLRHVALYRRHFDGDCVLVNGLGATETGIVRQYFMTPDSDIPGRGVPIGYHVEDMDVLLLDEAGSEVNPGEIGEIVVRSPYLALEYWRRPEHTAAAFEIDPKNDTCRRYRTGDLGRMLPDGCLEYLGRKSLHGKVRGLRTPVADIENELREHPKIEQAAVVVREDSPGAQKIVAYLVCSAESRPTVSELRRALTASLPEAMIPARFVFLSSLPTDANFKIDRRALPTPGRDRPALEQTFQECVTAEERIIASCFSDALEIDEIGLNDDFFELGGDSLAAMQLQLLIEDRLSIDCLPETVIEAPTVGGIVQRLVEGIATRGLVALQPGGQRPPLFCTHNYQGHLFDYRRLAQLMGPEQPVYGIASYGLQNGPCERRSVEGMAAAYIPEIRKIQSEGPYRLCGVCFGGVVAFEVAQQLRASGQEVALLALIDTAYPVGRIGVRLRHKRLRLGHHWRQLINSSETNAITYVGQRLWNVARRLGFAVRRCLTPNDKWDQYQTDFLPWIDEAHANIRAEAQYNPASYNGPVTLINIGSPTNQFGWRRVALNHLDTIEIAEKYQASRRAHPTEEPYVHDLVSTLRRLLDG